MKVYEENLQNFVTVDLNISYCGDSTLSFSLNSIEGGIQNIEMSGTLRIVLMLDSTSTLISGLEISFLKNPTFDFELMTALAPLNLYLSGDLLRAIIKDQISRQLVFPNKISINLTKSEARNLMPKIDGILRIGVRSVEGITGFEEQHVCAVIQLDNELAETPKATLIEGTGSLQFEGELVKYSQNEEPLTITVIVNGENDKEDSTFTCFVDVTNLSKDKKLTRKYPLTPFGSISLSLSWFTLCSDIKYLQIVPEKCSALLQVFVDSVRMLPKNQTTVIVQLSVDKESQVTSTLKPKSLSWKQHFKFFLVDPGFETLTVKLLDQRSSNELGHYHYNISDLMLRKAMEQKLQAFPLLQSIHGCELVMMLKLRVLISSS